MGLLRRVGSLALALALLGCFDPVEKDGSLRCGESGRCPDGFDCGAGGLCWRRGAPDGAPDGAADAGTRPDAPIAEPDAEPDAFVPACSNGIDDDCDGKIDKSGGDPGCSSDQDNDEHGTKKCDDGIDNDVDGYSDFHVPGCGPPGDPQCDRPDEDNES